MIKNNQKEIILLKDLGMQYPNKTSSQKYRFALYKCHCGNEFITRMQSVKRKTTQSCGCIQKQRVKEATITHNLSKHRLYSIFRNIKERCLNKNGRDYHYYGERGIIICNEWKGNFINFYNWAIDNGYKEELTIDRINNDGNYEPSNCRWSTYKVQANNKRILNSKNTSNYIGVSQMKRKRKIVFRAYIFVNNKQENLGFFSCPIEAAKARDKFIVDNGLINIKNF